MTTPTPTPALPVVIVRAPRGRWWIGLRAFANLDGERPSIRLRGARRLYIWPHTLGLAGLAVAADTEPLDQLQLGPAVPEVWLRDVEHVVWTTPGAGAALLAHPTRQRPGTTTAEVRFELDVSGVADAVSQASAQVAQALAALPIRPKTSGTLPGATRRIPTPAEVFRV